MFRKSINASDQPERSSKSGDVNDMALDLRLWHLPDLLIQRDLPLCSFLHQGSRVKVVVQTCLFNVVALPC